jgi:hypothetical protein
MNTRIREYGNTKTPDIILRVFSHSRIHEFKE